MADRRRINGPLAATLPPQYAEEPAKQALQDDKLDQNACDQHQQALFLKTGVSPLASGSAYLEMKSNSAQDTARQSSGMKLTCTVHGPRALPRSAPFSPHLVISTHVKYAPFATRRRRGYLRDSNERDLGTHLETALRGAIIADRWPKSGVDVVVTIIEGDDGGFDSQSSDDTEARAMTILASCITVASAAIADAGIDCVDTVVGGTASIVPETRSQPVPLQANLQAVEPFGPSISCCVAYLPSRDEITNVWIKGQLPPSSNLSHSSLIRKAVQAAKSTNHILSEGLREAIPGPALEIGRGVLAQVA